MKLVSVFLVFVLCILPFCAVAEEAGTVASDYDPLWQLAEPYGFKLGGAFSYSDLGNDEFMDFLGRHFNSLTCCNETKAYSLLDQRQSMSSDDGMPRMNYAQADKMIAWAQEHNIQVRGHVLVWDAYMTPWFFREGYRNSGEYADLETMRARLASYIDQVMTHFEEKFPGVIYCWDVVNEAIGDSDREYSVADPRHLRTKRDNKPNCFREYLGDDYVEYAFLCARNTQEKLGADIKLFYNDYNLFFMDKRTACCELVKSIQSYAKDADGNPRSLIDGVGMQGYMGGYGEQAGCLDPGIIKNVGLSIRTYASLGLQVQLTEMAVRNFDKSKVREHDAFYAELFSDVFMKANTADKAPLTAVCIWGLVDAPVSMKGNYVYNLNSPYGCLLTTDYKIKTCFDAVYHTLKGE